MLTTEQKQEVLSNLCTRFGGRRPHMLFADLNGRWATESHSAWKAALEAGFKNGGTRCVGGREGSFGSFKLYYFS